MRRWIVLGVLVTVGALSLVVTASQQQGEMVIEVEQLEDNLFVLRGGWRSMSRSRGVPPVPIPSTGRRHPNMVAAAHVDRGDTRVRWLEQR